jgi:hypothetical protein
MNVEGRLIRRYKTATGIKIEERIPVVCPA